MVRLRERQNWNFRSDTLQDRNGLIHLKAKFVPGLILTTCYYYIFLCILAQNNSLPRQKMQIIL
jgi:hypothetical protein